jgi:hypothetical protein
MPRRSGKLPEATILFVRFIESLIVVAFATGVDVVGIFIQNPFISLQTMYDVVYKASNIFYVAIGILVLYLSDLDKPILKEFRLFSDAP